MKGIRIDKRKVLEEVISKTKDSKVQKLGDREFFIKTEKFNVLLSNYKGMWEEGYEEYCIKIIDHENILSLDFDTEASLDIDGNKSYRKKEDIHCLFKKFYEDTRKRVIY